ncbi:MAG: FtsK/SpoIIIE domain-containing protein [Oligoflexia bacterium]|nr:FtsK/SpoIIIE domain-containing protein [Oligoflexia bacterium]
MEENEKPWPLAKRIGNVIQFAWSATQELYHGIKKDRVPAHRWCIPGIVIALMVVLHWDEVIARSMVSLSIYLFGSEAFSRIHLVPTLNLSPYTERKVRHAIAYLLLFSGWVAWGLYRAWQKNSFLDRLTDALGAARLLCNGRYPAFIEDVEIDEHSRRLRLRTYGVTKSEFLATTEKLEALLNVTIVRIIQEEDKGIVDIVYSTQDLPRIAYLERAERFDNGKVPIGFGHNGDLAVDLRHVGHILVAGQTGGGKSNSLKVMTSTLAQNNPNAEIFFLDFKGGMESADLKNEVGNMNCNIVYREGSEACAKKLSDLGEALKGRLEVLAKASASNLDDYQKKQTALICQNGGEDLRQDTEVLKRQFIVIDEAAQLYVKEPGLDRDVVNNARVAVNRIARQGRAAGVHLIVATQKPDSSSFDQTVKANLPAILCFPMATQAASVAAVGTKRAYELNPDIKGRAVWKFGPSVEEIQTYLFN